MAKMVKIDCANINAILRIIFLLKNKGVYLVFELASVQSLSNCTKLVMWFLKAFLKGMTRSFSENHIFWNEQVIQKMTTDMYFPVQPCNPPT